MRLMLAKIDKMDEELKRLGQQIELASLRRRLLSEKRAAVLEKLRGKMGGHISRVRLFVSKKVARRSTSREANWKTAALGFLATGPHRFKDILAECTRQLQYGLLKTKIQPGDKIGTTSNVSQTLNAAKKSGEARQDCSRRWFITEEGRKWLSARRADEACG